MIHQFPYGMLTMDICQGQIRIIVETREPIWTFEGLLTTILDFTSGEKWYGLVSEPIITLNPWRLAFAKIFIYVYIQYSGIA
jgi:hypothetical protein